MDPRRFDTLARRLGSGASRRTILKGFFGGAATALVVQGTQAGVPVCAQDGEPCGQGVGDCCDNLECGSNLTCQPFTQQCDYEGAFCFVESDCCVGQCCFGTCHDYFTCCPTEPFEQSLECGPGEYCTSNGNCAEFPCSEYGQSCGGEQACCQGLICENETSTCVFEEVPVVPTSKEQCQDGGWRTFSDPAFRNQGECIRFVRNHS